MKKNKQLSQKERHKHNLDKMVREENSRGITFKLKYEEHIVLLAQLCEVLFLMGRVVRRALKTT